MNRSHGGMFAELTACAWLLQEGYEVFRNVSPHGPYDIIAIKGDEILRLDVKSTPNVPRRSRITEKMKALGVVILHVDPTGKCQICRDPIIVDEIRKERAEERAQKHARSVAIGRWRSAQCPEDGPLWEELIALGVTNDHIWRKGLIGVQWRTINVK